MTNNEKNLIKEVVIYAKENGLNISKLAREIGVSRQYVHNKIKKFQGVQSDREVKFASQH
jgi:chromosome segregation and condensation protein ScpB